MPLATMFSPQPTTPYSPQDDELLSAYLDGRLTPAEAAQLEARLAADPTLRQRLQELRRVVQLLAQAPRLAVPRAFVLTEAQTAVASPVSRTWWMRWFGGVPRGLTLATAAVALALVVTLGVDMWSQRETEVAVLMAPAAQPETLAVAPTAEGTVATTAEVPAEAIVTLKAMTTTAEPADSAATVEEPGPMGLMAVESTPAAEETARAALSSSEAPAPSSIVVGVNLRMVEVILTAALALLVLAMVLARRRRAAR
jgi:anti-sigma factor RsiW